MTPPRSAKGRMVGPHYTPPKSIMGKERKPPVYQQSTPNKTPRKLYSDVKSKIDSSKKEIVTVGPGSSSKKRASSEMKRLFNDQTEERNAKLEYYL